MIAFPDYFCYFVTVNEKTSNSEPVFGQEQESMTDLAKQLESAKKEIRSLLLSAPLGLTVRELQVSIY